MDRRLVFSINSGRVGSEYLATVLGTAANAVAFHEPPPTMTGDVLRAVMEHGAAATLPQRRAIKEPAIRAAMAAAPDAVYVETSHMYVKTFHDVVDEAFAGDDVRVVVLRRDLAATLASFVRMGYFTPAGGPWRDWMHDAWAVGAHTRPPLPVERASPVDRCIAYLLDVEAMAQHHLRAHPDRCVEVRLEELQDPEAVRGLFERLDLVWTDETTQAVGRRVNERTARKDELGIRYSTEDATRDLAAYLEHYDRAGRPRPTLPSFTGPAGATPPAAPLPPRRGRPVRIAHLVNPVAAGPASDLLVAQPVTFAAMERAARVAELHGHHVELLATGLPEDRGVAPPSFRWVGDLQRTGLDLGTFQVPRRLPLLADLLDALRAAPDADLCIYTNVDIALMPGFYDAVVRLHERGHDAFVVNRRTIGTAYTDPADLALMEAQVGDVHPGHDCFVFRRELLDGIDVGEVVIGVPWVGRVLIWNLALLAEHFAEFTELHLTYHLGDDQHWLDARLRDWTDHNVTQAYGVLSRLLDGRTDLPEDAAIRPYLADLGLLG